MSLVNTLFKAIDRRYLPIVELSEYKVVEGDPRRERALRLASEYEIDLATAYQIGDKKITLPEVLRRKQTRTSAAPRQNENKRKNPS